MDMIVGERKIQGQQQHPLEQFFGKRQADVEVQARPLMHGFPAPRESAANLPRFQKCPKFVAPLRFDFVVLEDVEVFRVVLGTRRKYELLNAVESRSVDPCQCAPAVDSGRLRR